MASFAEDSAWDVLGLADPSKPLCLEVQQPMARYLADGSKTVETRRYELPSWATNVEVAVLETKDEPGLSTLGEAPDQGAGLLVGFVVFESCFEYDSEKAFDGDAAKHRIEKTDDARGWDGSPMYGWVVSKAQFCDLPPSSPPLARRHKGFYEAQGSGVAQVRDFGFKGSARRVFDLLNADAAGQDQTWPPPPRPNNEKRCYSKRACAASRARRPLPRLHRLNKRRSTRRSRRSGLDHQRRRARAYPRSPRLAVRR